MSLFVNYFNNAGIRTVSMVFVRRLITSLFMVLCLAIFNPRLLKIKMRDLWCFLGNGLLSLLTFSFCYFKAIEKSSAATAAVLLYTAPVIVMIFSVFFFKEKVTASKIIACAAAVCGCVLTSGIIGGGKFSTRGLIYGLCAGFCYALYSIFTRFAMNKGYHPLTVIAYSFSAALLGCLPFTDIPGTFSKVTANLTIASITVLMGFVSSVIPYFMYTTSLKYIESSKASIIASVELAVAALTGYFAFGQNPGIAGTIGIVLVFSAVIILNIKPKNSTGL